MNAVVAYAYEEGNQAGTQLWPPPTNAALEAEANRYLQYGVAKLDVLNRTFIGSAWDTTIDNDRIDYFQTGDRRRELKLVIDSALDSEFGDQVKAVYVRQSLTINWDIANNVPADTNQVTLAGVGGIEVSVLANPNTHVRYCFIDDSGNQSDEFIVTAVAGNTLTVHVLASANNRTTAQRPAGDFYIQCITYSIGGISTPPVVVSCPSLQYQAVVTSHELLHRTENGGLTDILDVRNIMHYTRSNINLQVAPPLRWSPRNTCETLTGVPITDPVTGNPVTENQWEKIDRE